MNVITRRTTAILLLLIALTVTAAAQQKRQTTPRPQPKASPTPAPSPPPTFDTLLPADTYVIYGEVRGAGQLIRSSALNELLEPVLKLSGPPKEFKTVVRWLNAHADEVMTSRLLIAAWPNSTAKNVPQTIVAIEFASAEEAAKFAGTLNEFLPTILPPSEPAKEGSKPATPPAPNFHLQHLGSLVVITPTPWTMKQLKPAGRRLLSEDVDFRTTRNRFNSEPVFAFLDVKAIEREDEERRKRWDAEAAERKKQAEEEAAKKEAEPPKPEITEQEKAAEAEMMAQLQAAPSPEMEKEPPPPDPFSTALSMLATSFFSAEPDWPDGVGFALSFEGDSFDLRALLVNQAGDKTYAIPFVPMLITGPAFSPEAPNIFPADSELVVTMSLDLPQVYAAMMKPVAKPDFISSRQGKMVNVKETELESPFAVIEQRLKIKIKDDLLPLLGSEVALRMPTTELSVIGFGRPPGSTTKVKEGQSSTNGPALAIAVRDLEGMRALMPKLIENLGFKGASSFAQTERREDTEIVSYANLFSYAFIGNFLVLSTDPAVTRHIVDSYLKHETLAADSQFRNSTRWQPRPMHGQLYLSPALMESYKTWAQQPTTRVSDQTRAFLVRASSVPQAITYSLSDEGFGPLHEVHIPKNLVLMAVAGIASETNPPPTLQNERTAIGLMYTIAYAEQEYKKKKGGGSCGTLDELIAANLVSKDMVESSRYRFDVTVSGDKFEVTAVPLEYGKSGNLSLFIDHTGVLRGADHNGASATVSDPPIN